MGRLRVTQAKKTKGKKQLSPQEAFAKLWKQVQNEQLLLGQLPGQIQQFYELYKEKFGPLEALWCELQQAEIQLMLSHWPRKSLRDSERLYLVQYVVNAFSELKSNPFRTFDIAELEATLHNVLLPPEDLELPKGKKSPANDDMFDDVDSDHKHSAGSDEADFFTDDDFDEHFKAASRMENDTASELFNATSLNKMFRQLSKVLHPDLEQDEELKKHKHELMSQLLTARDKHDVGTIVSLYSQHIGGDGAQFSAEDFPRLTLLLKKQLREIQFEKEQLAMQSGTAGIIYHRFQHKNANRQKTLLMQREAVLASMCADIEYSLDTNNTVKNLKEFLADWADEPMSDVFLNFDDY